MGFPLLLNHPEAQPVFERVIAGLPEDVEVYLIGGAIRNALFRHHFGERLRQRDYDQIVTRNSQHYLDFLHSQKFLDGGPVRTVLYKPLVDKPDPDGYDDSVVFDINRVDGTTALDNLTNHVGLSINGFALAFRDILAPNWIDRIIELPNAKNDLAAKRMRLNMSGYRSDPAYFFSVLRFMSVGFTPPPKEEVRLLLDELPKLESIRFGKNIVKLYDYVGSEDSARQLATQLGVKGDVFDERSVKGGEVSI